MDKLYSLTAMQMKDLLEKKEVSSVEITKSVIDRIEKTDTDIQAYISYNFEDALKKAEKVDEKIAKGEALGYNKSSGRFLLRLCRNCCRKPGSGCIGLRYRRIHQTAFKPLRYCRYEAYIRCSFKIRSCGFRFIT